MTVLERLEKWSIPEPNSGCWLWIGWLDISGYGKISIKNVYSDGSSGDVFAHRVSYELFREEIPDELTIDHLCRVRSCINPYHLEPVTIKINTLRGNGPAAQNARKTTAPCGHVYNAINSHGVRCCKECNDIYVRNKNKKRYSC